MRGKTARLAGVTIHDAASFVSSANALVAAEQRGAKTKKRLAIDAIEVEIVRMIFRPAYEGKGSNGPLGVKALACHLNEHDHRIRRGARRGIAPLHSLLASRTYMGEHRFNRKTWKAREAKPESEQIAVPVEPILDRLKLRSLRKG